MGTLHGHERVGLYHASRLGHFFHSILDHPAHDTSRQGPSCPCQIALRGTHSLMVVAVLLIGACTPILIILRLGHGVSAMIVSLVTGILGAMGVGIFLYTTWGVQMELLQNDRS